MRETETRDRMIIEAVVTLSICVQIPEESNSRRKDLINGEDNMAEELHPQQASYIYFSRSGRTGQVRLV